MNRSFSPQARAGAIFCVLSLLLLFSFNNCSGGMNSYSEEVTGVTGGIEGLASVAMGGYCLLDGIPMETNTSMVAYRSSKVPTGQSCIAQTRTCKDGKLSGSYGSAFCAVETPPPGSCLFNADIVNAGNSVIAYAYPLVASGQVCTPQTRHCDNGTLSGSFMFPKCSVSSSTGFPCGFGTDAVASGTTVIGFEKSSVPPGQSCASQTRTCTNGILSGTYAYTSCKVAPVAIATNATRPVFNFNFRAPYNFESVNSDALDMSPSLNYFLFPTEVADSYPMYICTDMQTKPNQNGDLGVAYHLLQRECNSHQQQLGIAGYVSKTQIEGLVPLYEYANPETSIRFDGDPGIYYTNLTTHLLTQQAGGYVVGYVRRP